jgi:2-dehydropantoate 2-reductase
VITAAFPQERVIGAVVHASTFVAEPGVVQHVMGQGLIIGEPTGGRSARVQAIGDLLAASGFDVTVSDNVRYDIWYKLWGNLTTNPVSAITGATADRIVDDPLVSAFCRAAMAEAAAIGDRIGCHLNETPAERHEVTRKLGAFKTSMLQDALAGRPLELDAIVGAVRELGQLVAVPTPQIDTLFGLARLFARVHGLYPDAQAPAAT